MVLTHERVVPGFSASSTEAEHWARYRFASEFVSQKRVGDIACGTGYGSHHMAGSGASEVLGIDLSDDAVAYAKETYKAPNLRFETGNAEVLKKVPDGAFDVVTSFETIEHLRNVPAYLAQVHRVLAQGGSFFVSTPDRRFDVMYPISRRPRNQYHVFEYSRKEFLAAVGMQFEIAGCFGQTFLSPLWVFWPIQTLIKLSARIAGAGVLARWKHGIYDPQTEQGLAVQAASANASKVAKYWLLHCVKR